MKHIDTALLQQLTQTAHQSPRKRSHYTLHTAPTDAVQRMVMGLEPSTYIQPHRHAAAHQWELFVVLKGQVRLLTFDDTGRVKSHHTLSPQDHLGLELPAYTWHTVIALTSGTLVLEVKPGPYVPAKAPHAAHWAPIEGEPHTDAFLAWAKTAQQGERFSNR